MCVCFLFSQPCSLWLTRNSLKGKAKEMELNDQNCSRAYSSYGDRRHIHVVVSIKTKPGHSHVYAAISAIIGEDLEFFTPMEEIVSEDTSLPNVTEEEEDEEFYSLNLYHGGMAAFSQVL